MAIKNVRNYSFDILYNIFYNDKLLNSEINDKFKTCDLSDENKSYIKKECTGVIEKLDIIDSIINKYSKVKTNKLKKDIIVVLRLGTYEIMYMDKVPNFATVSECVNIIKSSKYSKLSGYVNAVLKNISKNESYEETEKDNKRAYFRIYNNSEEKVIEELCDKSIKFSAYDGALQFKNSKIYYTDSYKDILNLEAFKNGNLLIMDASSAFLSDALSCVISSNLNIESQLKFLDTCAAPGGKILALYDILNKTHADYIYEARDISEYKINKINENIDRLHVKNITTKVHDATILNVDDMENYDVVICDVPCSGLGVLDKKPDISLRFNEDKLESLVKLQLKILEVSKQYVKSGGILSYSTCTETKEENEENIKYFLKKNSNFRIIYEKQIIHGDENKSDGFYICFLNKL